LEEEHRSELLNYDDVNEFGCKLGNGHYYVVTTVYA